jgi:hypothetical protein
MTSYCLTIAGNICFVRTIDKRLFVPDYMSKCHVNDARFRFPRRAKKA